MKHRLLFAIFCGTIFLVLDATDVSFECSQDCVKDVSSRVKRQLTTKAVTVDACLTTLAFIGARLGINGGRGNQYFSTFFTHFDACLKNKFLQYMWSIFC